MIKVAPLTDRRLEERASGLLAEYAGTIGGPVDGPIPVDEIAMYHLALRLECVDLHATLNIPMEGDTPDILGAVLFDEELILIDRSLDPETYPGQLGRYRYSIGHEICHWRHHRSAVMKNRARRQSAIYCRESEATRAPIERQAENFSAFLLMPRERVFDAWGQKPPFAFDVAEHGSDDLRRLWRSLKPDPVIARATFKTECEGLFDEFAGPLAGLFQVSKQAMRIRLENLGLLRRTRAAASALAA